MNTDLVDAAPAASLFPPPTAFSGKSPRDDPNLFSRSPWFHHDHFRDHTLLSPYVTASYLPGELPIQVVASRDWQLHGALPEHFLFTRSGGSPEKTREEWVRLCYRRLTRTIGRDLISSEFDVDLAVYRTDGERDYVARLDALRTEASWRGYEPQVRQAALLFDVQLRAEFRYLRKRSNTPFWDKIRFERRARCRHNVFVPYQNVEVDLVRAVYRYRCYVKIPLQWAQVEICEGFVSDISPVISYLGSEIISNPGSGLWTVVYTEFVAKVAANWLWEMYDTYRMWWLSPTTRQLLNQLDLRTVLGGDDNYDEFRRLMAILAEIDWDDPKVVPLCNNKRSNLRRNFSPGRRHPNCGDFVWFNPWARTMVTSEEARYLRDNPRPMPPGHPTGYLYNAEFSEGECEEYPRFGDSDDVEMDEEDIESPGSPPRLTAAESSTTLPSSGAGSSARDEREVIADFLRGVGVPESDLDGDLASLQSLAKCMFKGPSNPARHSAEDADGAGPSGAGTSDNNANK